MKLFAVAAVLGLAIPAFTQPTDTYTLWYDTFYDQTENSFSSVACSNGEHGLLTKGYNTFGELPTYPYVGGAPQIQSWNSLNCGTCWDLTYTDSSGVSTSASFTAINTAAQGGFSISLEGMNWLTVFNALTLDGVSITATQVPESVCGLIPVKRV